MARTRTPSKKPATARTPAVRFDGFANAVSGLGTSVDRLSGATVRAFRDSWQSWDSLETLYYEDDIAARVVDAIVDDAMRQGVEVAREQSIDDGEDAVDESEEKRASEAILRRLRVLDALGKTSQAARWGRLYGGGAVLLGMDDGAHDRPLAMGRSIAFLAVLERRELAPGTYYEDPSDPKFGQVQTWRVNAVSGATSSKALIVHESRLLTFEGIPVSKVERARQGGFSLSVLTRVYEVLRDSSQNWRSVGNLLAQSTQAVFKLDGLVSMIANGQEQTLQERMAAANLGRSILRAVVIDKDGEDFSYQNASLGGLDVILDKTWQRLAAAADMPVTRLMGMSPAGLNATGESDVRGWYDRVRAYQQTALGPQIDRLVQVIAAEQGDATPTEWRIAWPSLWQMSPTEEAAYRKTVADTDVAYIGAGVLTPEEVAIARFGGRWSADTVIDVEVRQVPAEPAAVPPEQAAPMPPDAPEVE